MKKLADIDSEMEVVEKAATTVTEILEASKLTYEEKCRVLGAVAMLFGEYDMARKISEAAVRRGGNFERRGY